MSAPTSAPAAPAAALKSGGDEEKTAHAAAAAPRSSPSLSEKLKSMYERVRESTASLAHELVHLDDPLSSSEVALIHAWWRAANFLTVGQIYLASNPLLKQKLTIDHIKPRLLGHFGTSPGINLVYVHMNRLIKSHNLDVILLCGPGHCGPATVANVYLEGTYTEVYPDVTQDEEGIRKLFRQFSTPGGIPSHVSPNVPGSIHEGGELGYVLVHAFGAVLDHPSLIALAVVGDGEAETAPLEGSWKGISFVNPVYDGAVLPVLHLNGWKISGPTVLGRESDANIRKQLEGHGYEVIFVEGTDPLKVHQALAKAMEYCVGKIQMIQQRARAAGKCEQRPQWPMIVLRTLKGWTGPKVVDGKKVEGTFRSHQVPLAEVREKPEHLAILEQWLHSYHPEELFDEKGRLRADIAALAPLGSARMSAQPVTNGGGPGSKPLQMPSISDYALKFSKPGATITGSIQSLGALCRDLYKLNPSSFRVFCPDETNSNRLGAVFEEQKRTFMEKVTDDDEALGHDGRVMEVLSEHNCNGWLEGYAMTGRFGLLATYEAFAMIFVSMTLQTVKWYEVCSGEGIKDEFGNTSEKGLPWRKPVSSINLLLTSTCWRNDHNGFSHQGPSFVDALLSKHGNVCRIYFPVDANTLLVTMEHCFGGAGSKNHINLIVQDKQPQLQYLSLDEAKQHFERGMSVWHWASNEVQGEEPDIIIASCGDIPTLEALAATSFLREHAPDVHVRFVNVCDLMAMYQPRMHPHGMSDDDFKAVFTDTADVVFAYHAFPGSLHQLVHNRPNPTRFHVRGYSDNGTTTTPFDMVVLNRMSRAHLVALALKHIKKSLPNSAQLLGMCKDMLTRHRAYVLEHMNDLPEVKEWVWNH